MTPENQAAFEALAGTRAVKIGTITDTGRLVIKAKNDQIDVATTEAKQLWEDALTCLMK